MQIKDGIVVLTDDQFHSFVQGNQVILQPNQQIVYLGQKPNSAIRQPLMQQDLTLVSNQPHHNPPHEKNPPRQGNPPREGNPSPIIYPPLEDRQTVVYRPLDGNPSSGVHPQPGVYPPKAENPSFGVQPPEGNAPQQGNRSPVVYPPQEGRSSVVYRPLDGNLSSSVYPQPGVYPNPGVYPPREGNQQFCVQPPDGNVPRQGNAPRQGNPSSVVYRLLDGNPSGAQEGNLSFDLYPPPGGNPPPGWYPPPGGNPPLRFQPGSQPEPCYDDDLYQAFFITLPTAMGAYIFFLLGCIIIQYVVCGALTAGQLWISCLVFVLVGSILIKLTRQYNQVYFLFASMFFFFLQQILEIAAFAIAVSHPPILIMHFDSNGENYNQDAGSCFIYSDATGLPSRFLKYNNGLQYGCLVVDCIQFILSFFVCYQFGRKSWFWQKNLREINHAQQVQVA